jgi:hypothetical protein
VLSKNSLQLHSLAFPESTSQVAASSGLLRVSIAEGLHICCCAETIGPVCMFVLQAAACAPSIIFLDELDGLVPARSVR